MFSETLLQSSARQQPRHCVHRTAFFLLLLISPMLSAQSYNGQWQRTSLRVTVTVDQWGENCGVQPKSYASNTIRETNIIESDGHLRFSTDGIRTDRCNSPNPDLVMVSRSITRGNWKRVCETPKSVSKQERIDYTLSGDTQRLTYIAKSNFRWTLKNDNCVVSWVEQRGYSRPKSTPTPPSTPTPKTDPVIANDSPVLKVHEDLSSFATTKAEPDQCVPGTPLRRLILFPETPRLAPGQKTCFQIRGVDADGCRFSIPVRWSVTRNGIPHPHLMKGACFIAGTTAAETEGIYHLSATSGTISATTTVEVAYPDFGDLARARLLLAEAPPESPTPPTSPSDTTDSPPIIQLSGAQSTGAKHPLPSSSPPHNRTVLIIIAIVIFLIAGVAVLLFTFLRRSRSAPHIRDINRCAICCRLYATEAHFCPEDRAELSPWRGSGKDAPPENGMVCPECQRGYAPGARFCPEDSTPLIPYIEWIAPTGEDP